MLSQKTLITTPSLASTLTRFAEDQKIAFSASLSGEQKLKQLIVHVTPKLADYLKTFDNNGTELTPIVTNLLKQINLHNQFSMQIQMLLHSIHNRLLSRLQNELAKHPCNEDTIIALINAGININTRNGNFLQEIESSHLPLLAVTIKYKLFKVSRFLLSDINLDLTQISAQSIIEAMDSMPWLNGRNSIEKDRKDCITIFHDLCLAGFSVKNMFHILNHNYPWGTIGSYIAYCATEEYYDLLIYLYENKLPASDIALLLSFNNFIHKLTALNKPEKLIKFLNLYMRLLHDRPSAAVINSVIQLFNVSQAGTADSIMITVKQNHEEATRICLKLLYEILKLTKDSSIIYQILQSQHGGSRMPYGFYIASCQPEVFQDYQDLLFALAKHELANTPQVDQKTEREEKHHPIQAPAIKNKFENLINLLKVHGYYDTTLAHGIPNKKINNVSYHLTFLRYLLKNGAAASQIIEYLGVATRDNRQTFGHCIGAASPVASKDYLLLLIDLSKSAAKAVCQLLLHQEVTSLCNQGMFFAETSADAISTYLRLLMDLSAQGNSTEVLNILTQKNKDGKTFGILLAENQDGEAIETYLQLLTGMLDHGAPADSIYNLLKIQPENSWDFFTLSARHANFDLHTYFNLLTRLEKKITAGYEPINLLMPVLKLNNMADSKTPCEEIKNTTDKLSINEIHSRYGMKQIFIHADLLKSLSNIVKDYKLNFNDTDTFENTLLTMAGISAHATECHFMPANSNKDYPYDTRMTLGLTEADAKSFVEKLNQAFPGVVRYSKPDNNLQELFFNTEILIKNVLTINGSFHQHLKDKFEKNPLQLISYQMECGVIPKIDIEKQIISKLMEALGPKATDLKARTSLLPQTLLKMAGITEMVDNAMFLPGDKTKISYADAIIDFVLALKPDTTNTFVTRFNALFPFSARIIKDTEPTVHIALSKQLLSSEKFIAAFKECFTKPDIKKDAVISLSQGSSTLFATSVMDEKTVKPTTTSQPTMGSMSH